MTGGGDELATGLEVRVVRRLARIVLFYDDAFIKNDDDQINEEDGDEKAMVFDLP